MTREEWYAEGRKRFGGDMMTWRFVCPVCGHIASVNDYKDAGAPEGAIAYSCIGRYISDTPRQAFGGKGNGPCNYAGGGLFKMNPVQIDGEENVFEFAPEQSGVVSQV